MARCRTRKHGCTPHAFAAAFLLAAAAAAAQSTAPISFNTNFESGCLGKITKISETHFLCAVPGQQNHEGRNRQPSWYFFEMENVKGRDITIELTDIEGEYNYHPGTFPINKDTRPLYSYDRRIWRHFEKLDWDDRNKRAILRFRPEQDRIWIAHIQPYTTKDLRKLLDDIRDNPNLRIEVIGKSAQGRDLYLLTVTNFDRPDEGKKTVWLMARQHAWETGSSFVAEGAIRYIVSDDAEARRLRDRVIFKFTPMVDPDGVANGGVRFNANGYDVNRHWDEVDLRRPEYLRKMPEIWYTKKAIVGYVRRSGRPIALLVYLHNDEYGEFVSGAPADDPEFRQTVERFFDLLVSETTFDASRRPGRPDTLSGTSLALYRAAGVRAVLMEQKITMNKKLGRYPTAEDRLAFGRGLIRCMAWAVLGGKHYDERRR